MRAVVAEHELRAVRRRARHPERADRAAAADRIFHDDGLPERLGHALRQDAAGDVARPAGGERHDQRERAGFEGLRAGGGANARATNAARMERAKQLR